MTQTQEEYQNNIKVQNSLSFKTDNKIDKYGPYVESPGPGEDPTGQAKIDFDELCAMEHGRASYWDNYGGWNGSGSGSESGGGLGPDTVGTAEIIDNSITVDDLNDEIRRGLNELNNIELTEQELEDIYQNNQNG